MEYSNRLPVVCRSCNSFGLSMPFANVGFVACSRLFIPERYSVCKAVKVAKKFFLLSETFAMGIQSLKLPRELQAECIPIFAGEPIVDGKVSHRVGLIPVEFGSQVAVALTEQLGPLPGGSVYPFKLHLVCAVYDEFPDVHEYLFLH